MLYKILRQFLFVLNPEISHNVAIWCIKKLFLIPGLSRVLSFYYCLNDKYITEAFKSGFSFDSIKKGDNQNKNLEFRGFY